MHYVEATEPETPGLIPPKTAIQGAVWPASQSDESIRIDDGDRIQLLLAWTWHEDQEQRNELWEWEFTQHPLPEEPEEPEETAEPHESEVSQEPSGVNWWLIGGGAVALATVAVLLLTGVIPPLW